MWQSFKKSRHNKDMSGVQCSAKSPDDLSITRCLNNFEIECHYRMLFKKYLESLVSTTVPIVPKSGCKLQF